MIHGHRPNGYFVKGVDEDGNTFQGETRYCCHCQYTWEYRPGSGTIRGWCLKHSGFMCDRPECFKQQEVLLAQYEKATGKALTCIAWEEWVDFQDHQIHRGGTDYVLSESGLLVPREYLNEKADTDFGSGSV